METFMKAIVQGSLSAVAKKENASLAETFLNVDAILLVDVSGSMDTPDAEGGLTRHKAADKELEALQKQLPGKLAIIAFSDYPLFCPSGITEKLNGGTDLAKALEFVKPADGLGIKIIVISDGYPNDRNQTLKIARTFKSKIDVVYIGPEIGSGGGKDFLRELAEVSGGEYIKTKEVAKLADPVKTLLLKA
jgi:Mg-chelatase subunit ChlD